MGTDPAFIYEPHIAAREANVPAMNVMLCHRSHWASRDVEIDAQLHQIRRVAIIAVRL